MKAIFSHRNDAHKINGVPQQIIEIVNSRVTVRLSTTEKKADFRVADIVEFDGELSFGFPSLPNPGSVPPFGYPGNGEWSTNPYGNDGGGIFNVANDPAPQPAPLFDEPTEAMAESEEAPAKGRKAK